MKIFTISVMSEMLVECLMVEKACSKTAIDFSCCLMCLLWMQFRKAVFMIRRIMDDSDHPLSSSGTMSSLFFCTPCSAFFSWTSTSFFSKSYSCRSLRMRRTWSLKLARSTSRCFCITEMRCRPASMTPLPAAVSSTTSLSCEVRRRISPFTPSKMPCTWQRSCRILSIRFRSTSLLVLMVLSRCVLRSSRATSVLIGTSSCMSPSSASGGVSLSPPKTLA
mmetsp:Transcript_30678/g.91053  ORF Transcript_30678/g.91053 Transcript_30678/m.91053 type:complete len:221 (+) Transcript_30678:1524-2186(+)